MADYRSTPAAYRDNLAKRLTYQQQYLAPYYRYYDGDHPLGPATQKYREAFGTLFRAFADNWMPLVVSSSVERLQIEGFEFHNDALNRLAMQVWHANFLDAESSIAHTEAVKTGYSYVTVDPTQGGFPLITAEDPREVFVFTDPGNRRRRLAALKRWINEDEYLCCNLYLPDVVYKWTSTTKATSITGNATWVHLETIENPLGVVPIVPIVNEPQLNGTGYSDLRSVLPLQDLLNKMMSDMVIGSEFYSYPQRVITGLEIPEDDDGNPIDVTAFVAGHARLWAPEGDNVSVTQLAGSDLSSHTAVIDDVLRQIAALTKTPPNYLLGQIANISSDALIAAEAGLISKVKAKQKNFGPSWLEVMRLALKALGHDSGYGSIVWADPELKNIRLNADAASKLNGIVSKEYIWDKLFGIPPEEFPLMRAALGLPDPGNGNISPPTAGDNAGNGA